MPTLYNFDAHFGNPGMGTPVEEVQSPYGASWGKPFTLQFLPFTIDGAARDAGNTGYTDVLRGGLLLGKVFSTGKLKQWNPDATDGTHQVAGILASSLKMTQGGVDTDRFVGHVIVGGSVTARGIAVAALTAWGINAIAEEYNIRAQMAMGFHFDDDPMGVLAGRYGGLLMLSASATLSELHNGSLIVVRGASGAVNLTLGTSPKRGLRYRVYNAVNQDLTITAGTADTMVVYADATADSVSLSTSSEKIGGSFEIIGDGTGWLVIPSLWEGQTPTIVTA